MARSLLKSICTSLYNLGRAWSRLCGRYFIFTVLAFTLFLVVYILSNMYTYIIEFYLPTMQADPIKVDVSKLPIIKNQEHFVPSIIEPLPVKGSLFILVLINSAAASQFHYEKRMAIRNTWGRAVDTNDWRITFFLGKTPSPQHDEKRLDEAKKYGDIIIGDFPDTYRKITQKLMMAFHWASKQNFKYLLKTDDDVYVNIPSLINWINTTPHPDKQLYAGVLYKANIVRDPLHRHYVSWTDLPQVQYPWYPKGALYVLSSGIVRDMVRIASHIRMITVDDAYVGVLASHLGIKPVTLHGFIQWSFLPSIIELFDSCSFLNIFGMADNLTPDNIYFIHQKVTSLKDSSSWMCIHIQHPLLVTVILLLIIIVIVYRLTSKII